MPILQSLPHFNISQDYSVFSFLPIFHLVKKIIGVINLPQVSFEMVLPVIFNLKNH